MSMMNAMKVRRDASQAVNVAMSAMVICSDKARAVARRETAVAVNEEGKNVRTQYWQVTYKVRSGRPSGGVDVV